MPYAKSNKIMSSCDPFAKRLTISCTVMTSCDSQDRLYLKPCCASDKMLLASKCFIMLLCMICSIILHAIDVSDTGL